MQSETEEFLKQEDRSYNKISKRTGKVRNRSFKNE